MSFDPHFIAALAALLLSEIIPIISKSRYGGIVHALTALLGRLYSTPSDVSAIATEIAALKTQIDKLQAVPAPTPVQAPVTAPAPQA